MCLCARTENHLFILRNLVFTWMPPPPGFSTAEATYCVIDWHYCIAIIIVIISRTIKINKFIAVGGGQMKYAAIDAVRMICNLSALSNSFEKKSCMVTSYSTKQLYLVKSKSR